MKRLIIIYIFSLFIFSCGVKVIKEVLEKYGTGKDKIVHYYNQNRVLIKKYIRLDFLNEFFDKQKGYYSNINIKFFFA